MGWFGRKRGMIQPRDEPMAAKQAEAVIGAKDDARAVMTYNDKAVTFTGDLASYDYDSILRDKQRYINSLYELSDYFTDADPVYRGIVKGVYVPFALADDYRLIGANEQAKAKYEEYYERISLRDRMRGIFLQYFKYANVYVY